MAEAVMLCASNQSKSSEVLISLFLFLSRGISFNVISTADIDRPRCTETLDGSGADFSGNLFFLQS